MSTEAAVAINNEEIEMLKQLNYNTSQINEKIIIKNANVSYYASPFKYCKIRISFLDEETIKIYNWDNVSEFFKLKNDSELYHKLYGELNIKNNICIIKKSDLKSLSFIENVAQSKDSIVQVILYHAFFLKNKKAFNFKTEDLSIIMQFPILGQVEINSKNIYTNNRLGMHSYFAGNDLMSITIQKIEKKYINNDYSLLIGKVTLSEYPTCCGLMMVYGFSQYSNEYKYLEPLINNIGHAAGFSRFIFVNNNISRYDDYKKETLKNKLRKLIDFTNKRNTNKLGIFSQSITKYV